MLGSAYRRISTLFARALKPYGITPEQWSVLFLVAGREGINQKEVAAAAAKDQPTTARIVDLLLKKGFLEKSVSPSDRRAFLLNATAAGKQLLVETLPLEQQNFNAAVAGLSASRLEELRAMLELIHDNTGNMDHEQEN
ncbi:MarR family winged helix-turn-helix transcriptional regulator [Paenibacillus donghaensis]|uniref:Transcriptional regulator n=1 Tax=Paenibacillus donghaensis TaxID=414771 RepID=A0A2Z2KQF8_9BACL|nr:MarR family transcriptional regulator [Paenibacillus donghaensis]ASA21098.1 transcriptional regulator [Paenibacillus donghaensis]